MSRQNRALLEQTIYNIRFDMDCIGCDADMYAELSSMTDEEIENVLNDILSDL